MTLSYLPKISVSIGIAQRQDELNWTDVFEQADTALYQAKNMVGIEACVYKSIIYLLNLARYIYL